MSLAYFETRDLAAVKRRKVLGSHDVLVRGIIYKIVGSGRHMSVEARDEHGFMRPVPWANVPKRVRERMSRWQTCRSRKPRQRNRRKRKRYGLGRAFPRKA